MIRRLILIIFLVSIFSCKGVKKISEINEKNDSHYFNDSSYVVNPEFPKFDARRYGVTPGTAQEKHPFTGKTNMETVLDLAEKWGREISFPKGYYGMNLILDHRQNIKLKFNNSEFNLIHITQINDTLPKPKNISLKGTLIVYSRLGITEAANIEIDTVFLKSNVNKNLAHTRNRGCHIYHGCNGITINYLEIDDFGSGDKTYQYNHAALAVDGWNNNPENVHINKLLIKSTDRHGIYLTGKNHFLGDVVIDQFGMGNAIDMAPMQDAKGGEERDFKALWINKCYNSVIEKITINELDSKGKYTAHFDYGKQEEPVVIGAFNVQNDNPVIEILEEDPNGVVFKSKGY